VIKKTRMDQVRTEAHLRDRLTKIDAVIRDTEKEITELKSQKRAYNEELRTNPKGSGEDSEDFKRIWFWNINKRLKLLENQIKTKQSKLNQLYDNEDQASNELNDFIMNSINKKDSAEFEMSPESPVDYSKSKVVIQDRSFDSIRFHSSYINSENCGSEVKNFVGQLSGSTGMSSVFASANVEGSITSRVSRGMSSDRSVGTLLIGCSVTTRYVRCFENMTWDMRKLWDYVTILNGKSSGKMEYQDLIYFTEAVLGGSFIGLVHILKTSTNTNDLTKLAANSRLIVTANRDAAGDFSKNLSAGFLNEIQKVTSIASTQVEIEFISLGAIPGFKRYNMPFKVSEMADLNPSVMTLTKEDEDYVDEVYDDNYGTTGSKENKTVKYMEKKRIRDANSQQTIINTFKGVNEIKTDQEIHNINSLYDAFENFEKIITTDKLAGVPVGFNFQLLDKKEVERLIKFEQQKIQTEDLQKDIEYKQKMKTLEAKTKELEKTDQASGAGTGGAGTGGTTTEGGAGTGGAGTGGTTEGGAGAGGAGAGGAGGP